MKVIRTSELEPVVPPDGSEVREIARPPHSARNQSLAEATIQPGGETAEHYHRASEEIYHFVSGARAGCDWATRRARWGPARPW
jgi:mannose-6-phosphate isomerase-like protein (cupin superfamily)